MATTTTRRFGPFSIDTRERVLERAGQPVPLTPKAFDLLAALLEEPGRLVSKDELLHRVWPDTFVEESNLAYNVFALRKALGDAAEDARVHRDGAEARLPVQGASHHRRRDPRRRPRPRETQVLRGRCGGGEPWTVAATVPALALTVWVGTAWWRAPWGAAPPHAVPLTSLAGVLASPSLSPDGRYVVFSWMRPGQDNFDLYVQQVGAGAPLRLTTDGKADRAPSWSPDGRWIAFLRRGPAEPKSELWLIPPLGGVARKIADVAPRLPFVAGQMSLAWCPDSSCLLVTDSPGPAQGDALFAIAVDTGAKRQLTQAGDGHADVAPAVSRDGLSVVFRRHSSPFSGPLYRLALGSHAIPRGDAARADLDTHHAHRDVDARQPARRVLGRPRVVAARWAEGRDADPSRLHRSGRAEPGDRGHGRRASAARVIRSVADTNVWRLTTPVLGAPALAPPVKAIASTRSDFTAALSPDGHRRELRVRPIGRRPNLGGRCRWRRRGPADIPPFVGYPGSRAGLRMAASSRSTPMSAVARTWSWCRRPAVRRGS